MWLGEHTTVSAVTDPLILKLKTYSSYSHSVALGNSPNLIQEHLVLAVVRVVQKF